MFETSNKIHTPKTYSVQSLGCKANGADGEYLAEQLRTQGYVPHDPSIHLESPTLSIINGCTVTDEADRESRRAVERAAKKSPESLVVYTGCGAEVAPDSLKAGPGRRLVVGNRDKTALVKQVLEAVESPDQAGAERPQILGRVTGVDAEDLRSRHLDVDGEWPGVFNASIGTRHQTRAFVKVQEGCNHFCTYCIIPYGRGPARSLSIPDALDAVRHVVDAGTPEVVLTATNLGDFGMDSPGKPPLLGELVRQILDSTSIARLRLSSLDPTELTPDLLELFVREGQSPMPRLMPHVHVSLQSTEGSVLRGMKRKYSTPEVEAMLHSIASLPTRAPGGVFVGADVITGFPGETLEIFEAGLERLRRLPWTRLHVFPYSERSGTPATRMQGAVPPAERKRRARVLQALSLERQRSIAQRILDQSGGVIPGVLWEAGEVMGPDGTRSWRAGHGWNYWKVLCRAEPSQPAGSVTSAESAQIWVNASHQEVGFWTAVRPVQ